VLLSEAMGVLALLLIALAALAVLLWLGAND
jgi:hypothetical protein